MHLRSELSALLSLGVLLVGALSADAVPAGTPDPASTPAAVKVSDLNAQLAALPSLSEKLDFLKSNMKGQSLATNAALGASIIQSAPVNTQKEVAGKVAEILAGLYGETTETPKLMGLLVRKLSSRVAESVAEDIIFGAAKSVPQLLPQITAAIIVSQSGLLKQAGTIAGDVTSSAPLSSASSIASAIGFAFAENPRLAEQAPDIAADIIRAILPKGTLEQTRPEVANSVAALAVLLPGSIRSNDSMITHIGMEVAGVIADKNSGMATTIVGITSATLKSAAGSADITTVLDNFAQAFKSSIPDPIIQGKLDTLVTQINSGNSDKGIVPLARNPTSVPENPSHPSSPESLTDVIPPASTQLRPGGLPGFFPSTGAFHYGVIVPFETNVQPR